MTELRWSICDTMRERELRVSRCRHSCLGSDRLQRTDRVGRSLQAPQAMAPDSSRGRSASPDLRSQPRPSHGTTTRRSSQPSWRPTTCHRRHPHQQDRHSSLAGGALDQRGEDHQCRPFMIATHGWMVTSPTIKASSGQDSWGGSIQTEGSGASLSFNDPPPTVTLSPFRADTPVESPLTI